MYERLLVHVGSFIYRRHVEPRVKLHSPREESFPNPLKYIDVSRTTHTNVNVKHEKRIDDYWNIGGSRDLSDPWTGFTQFTPLDEKAPDGNIIFPFMDGTAKLSGRDHEVRESTLTQCCPGRSEDLRGEFQGNSDRSQPAPAKQKMTPKSATTSGRL